VQRLVNASHAAAAQLVEKSILTQGQRLGVAGAHLTGLERGEHALLDEGVGDALPRIGVAESAGRLPIRAWACQMSRLRQMKNANTRPLVARNTNMLIQPLSSIRYCLALVSLD
jgi:hypothetical protein